MKKRKVIIVSALFVVVIVAGLLYNRGRIQAKSRSETLSSVAVSVVKVTKQQLAENLSLVGTITANNDVAIVSETSGRVVSVHARVGDYKPAGSVLVQVDDELKSAAFATAEANYQRAKRDLERYQFLEEENAVSKWQKETAWQAFKVAEAQYIVARRLLKDTKITTPISGIVTSRSVDVGATLQNNTLVANVVDVSRLKLKLNVAERDAFKLKVGDAVEVATDVYPGVRFPAKVSTLSAKGDEAHTYPVEIVLDNSRAHPLKAGMFGKVMFTSLGATEIISIPRQALVGSLKNPQVFVLEGQRARLRTIVVGGESGTELGVVSGLKDDDVVVVNGQNNLKDSMAVQVIN